MSEEASCKVSCGTCDGHIAYPASRCGETVACPHCGKSVYLPYQAPPSEILEATVVGNDCPPNLQRITSPPRLTPPAMQPSGSHFGKQAGAIVSVILVATGIAIKIFFFSQSFGEHKTENLTQEVQDSIQKKFSTDPDRQGEIIKGFGLTKDSGNKYKGMLTLEKNGKTIDVSVDVTYDGHSFVWQAEPYSFPELPTTDTQSQPAPPAQSPPDSQPSGIQLAQQSQPSYEWNTSDIDAIQNGNIAVAVHYINQNPNLRQYAATFSPASVAKTPYSYYGRAGVFSGVVAVVQDEPPGSDFSQAVGGQNASDIVMETNDGTIVEMFCMKASGYIRVGSTVNLYGYPVGVTEVPNRVGGTFTHLILVGNDYDDLGVQQ